MNPSSIPLFGRGWQLSVRLGSPSSQVPTAGATFTPNQNVLILSQDNWDPEALRVTFDILQSTLPSPYWFADITVYNLNDPTMQNILRNANWITLSGGYQSGPSQASTIWDGPILQVMFERPNVVDYTIRFNCVGTTALLEENFVNFASGPFSTQYQAVSQMIAGFKGSSADQVSATAQRVLAAKESIRGVTYFGSATKFISDIASENGMTAWFARNQPNVSEFDAGTKTIPDVAYGPAYPPNAVPGTSASSITRSLIGTPQQTPFGATFTVLLDPRLQVKVPPMIVQLDQAIISQYKVNYPNLPPFPLDQSGLYVVAQVRHYGDTRGNDWYTEVSGWTRGYAQNWLKLLAAAAQGGVQ